MAQGSAAGPGGLLPHNQHQLLRYGLPFAFLNPARITPPDVDMDFCYHRRNEVTNML